MPPETGKKVVMNFKEIGKSWFCASSRTTTTQLYKEKEKI